MSIKILGGRFRGFPLATPRSETTRPTSVLIKRKLFDWRQNMEGFTFVDLCGGSGAVGFEALSRGADKVILNDSMKGAFLTLKQNKESIMKAFKVDEDQIAVTNLEVKSWLNRELSFQLSDTKDAVLFFDPPYENHALYTEVLAILKEVNFEGEVWIESDRLKGPKKEILTGAFCSIIKIVEQGDHFVVVGKLV